MTGSKPWKKFAPPLLTAAVLGLAGELEAGREVVIVPPPAEFFIRGDSNLDHAINISDPVRVLNYLFTGAEGVYCLEAADSNDDGAVDIADAVSLLNFLFVGGPDPQSPFNECGVDLSDDAIECAYYPHCADPLPGDWFVLRDNGQRCPDEPCFWITATPVGTPAAVLLSGVDVSHLNPPPPVKQTFIDALVQSNSNLQAGGFLQTGPPGSQGQGLTFIVLAVRIDNERHPDLAVTSLKVLTPEFPRGGGVDVPVQVRVTNLGPIGTERDFAVAIRRGAATLDSWRMGPLEREASAAVTTTLHFPESAKGDRVTITAVADTANAIEEPMEDNNSRSATFTVPDGCFIEIVNGKPVRICE